MLPELGEIPLKHFNNLMLTDWFAHLDVSPAYCRVLDRSKAKVAEKLELQLFEET